ncbi:lactonase family protein [Pedobacter sp. BS3]|nr:lactonase family protein [Pedobacter sp. BS3]
MGITEAQTYNLLIGTYTKSGKSEGIYVYTFNAETGFLNPKNKATGIENPSYLALSPDLTKVYSVSEFGKERNGSVYAYDFDAATGGLKFLIKKPSIGAGPCYIAVDAHAKYVFTANYAGGSLTAIPLNNDGSLSDSVQLIQHTGKSINPTRQQEPHVHSTVLSPDNKFVFVSDLGTDKIYSYRLSADNKSKPLAAANPPYVQVKAGNGPRHLVFSNNGKFAYLITEMGSNVIAFRYKDGMLKQLQSTSMLPEGFTGKAGAAAIHISPDGKFLYASNRLDLNEIVIYKINTHTGKLTYVGRESSKGTHPRDFAIDPTGNFLLVANQDTNDIYVFKRNKTTGLLTYNGNKLEVGQPVCLKFVH